MKRLYLEQQQIPLQDLTEEQTANIRHAWPCRYLVTKVVGAVEPKVRSHLTAEQVIGYCDDEAWHVEIT